MESPLISIVVPVYNAESTLRKCVDSILAQSYGNFELILINDGSKDKSLEICCEYEKCDGRIAVVTQDNQGVSIARNNGIAVSKGRYITFIDSDDWIGKDYLSGFKFLEFQADLYVEGIDYFFIHRHQYSNMFEYDSTMLDLKLDSKKIFSSGLPLNGCPVAKLYLRDIIIKHNIHFNPDFAINEDHLFVTEYISKIKSVYLSEATEYYYVYDVTKGSLTKSYHSPKIYLKLAREMENIYNITYGHITYSGYDTKIARYIFGPQQIINALFSSEKNSSLDQYWEECKEIWCTCNFNHYKIYAPTLSKRLICRLLDNNRMTRFSRLLCSAIIKYDKSKSVIKAHLRNIVFS